MTEIRITATLANPAQGVTAEAIRAALAQMGTLSESDITEIEVVPVPKGYVETFICIDSDGMMTLRDFPDHEIADQERSEVMAQGVCIALDVEHPRADKYGVPEVATDKGGRVFAAGYFRLSPDFEVSSQDSGDDGAGSTCAVVALSPALASKLDPVE